MKHDIIIIIIMKNEKWKWLQIEDVGNVFSLPPTHVIHMNVQPKTYKQSQNLNFNNKYLTTPIINSK